jgi:hypothetical protein
VGALNPVFNRLFSCDANPRAASRDVVAPPLARGAGPGANVLPPQGDAHQLEMGVLTKNDSIFEFILFYFIFVFSHVTSQ